VSKKLRPLTPKEIIEVKQLLQKGRNRYNNALLDIEQVWNKVKPHEYVKRAKLVKAALQMAKIDASLKVWEHKVNLD
jgi:hypothetical protein